MILADMDANFCNCEWKPEKLSSSTGFEPVNSRYRYHALTNWTMKPLMMENQTHKWPIPIVSGLIAQLAKASHRYREVTGLNPVEVLNFSGFYVRNFVNCVLNCDDHSLLDFTSAVQYMRYFIYNFSFIPHGFIRTHKWAAPNVSGFIAQLVRACLLYTSPSPRDA